MTTTTSVPEAIVEAVGGPGNISSLTHCATRLRFELHDASVVDKAVVEAIPGVMGAVPQSGDRYQIVIGGAVQGVYTQIMNLPSMQAGASRSDADVKAAARAKARGKNALVDAFFEYLSDSFRPLLPVLLGASLIIAFEAVLDALGVVDFRDDAAKGTTWVYVDTMWRAVFYFLPVMVAYNASKKLNIDPWVGTAVMASLLTPNFISLGSTAYTETQEGSGLYQAALAFSDQVECTTNTTLGTQSCVAQVFGLPMQLNDYGGQVFVPLIMVAVLALVYKALTKVFPANVQMVFVPFFSFVIMMPVTAFLIGPMSIWLGTGLGSGLAWLNGNAPIVFAILIPLIYPFLVPLGLHWPLNALMLANIASPATGHMDFIQGPMGSWNFACFGATAGVLVWSMRDRDREMRQTASGALAAGLLGGISEPSLYGIHLRFKRIYPLMLVGCLVGGLITGIGGGIETGTFAFTSLLTIPIFDPMALYAVAITASFFTSFFLIVAFNYRTKEERAAAGLAGGVVKADPAETAADLAAEAAATAGAASGAAAPASGSVTEVAAPLAGHVLALADVADPVFSSGALGNGAAIEPVGATIVVTAPAAGTVVVAPSSGHAYGITLDNGVELLIHVGIDTVNLGGQGFDVKVSQGDRVEAGQELVHVDRATVEAAGYALTTPVLVTNTASFASVEPAAEGEVAMGDLLLRVTA
ncbi:glucose PTS transporter subunit IIA [Actinomyces sp. W5033]|uniref:glucose PTS transporter subunit IIA n=1 Tax=Actinomyces sp. W5033 TaxID=3446479 RepID=UPI003EDE7DCA